MPFSDQFPLGQGCLVYCKATFENDTLTETCLDSQDFDSYELDEKTDTYHFEGKEYDSEWEILLRKMDEHDEK